MMEIVVIGGGIAGSAVALALRERGAAVNLVDPSSPGGEATGASGGMLAPQYECHSPGPLFRLLLQARSAYPGWVARLERLSGLPVPTRWEGMLVANPTAGEHKASRTAIAWHAAEGEPAELLDPSAAARLQPGISADPISYLWFPREGQVDSQALAEALGPALDAAGVRRLRARAVGVLTRRSRVAGVLLGDGRRLDADLVVVAAGVWSGALTGLPSALPVRPVLGQMLRFRAGSLALRTLVAARGGRYVVPRSDGSVLVGSTMDEVGFDASLEDAGLKTIHADASRLVPGLGALRAAEQWTGLRPLTPDRLPILGPDREITGLSYATGYGRHGILLAPLAAEILADHLLRDGQGSPVPDFLSLRRFAGV
jgi:glycine oxidase